MFFSFRVTVVVSIESVYPEISGRVLNTVLAFFGITCRGTETCIRLEEMKGQRMLKRQS